MRIGFGIMFSSASGICVSIYRSCPVIDASVSNWGCATINDRDTRP